MLTKQILLFPLVVILFNQVVGTYGITLIERINMYTLDANGSSVRVFSVFGGGYDLEKCVMFCGCSSLSFAGHDGDACWCGNEGGVVCDSEPHCIDKYDASGITSSFVTSPPLEVKVFEDIQLDITQVTGVDTYGVVINEKLLSANTSQPTIRFADVGMNSLSIEPGAFLGCQSEALSVNVYDDVNVTLKCSNYSYDGNETTCYATVSGTNLTSVKWYIDTAEESTTEAEGSFYHSIGARMETNRFEDYWESFDWDIYNEGSYAYISINNEIQETGKIRAFEAYITRLNRTTADSSCIRFMVLKPFCDLAIGDGRYCTREKVCGAAARTTCDDGFTEQTDPYDYSTYNSDGTDTVWCMEADRFTNTNNFTYPPLYEFDVLKTHYRIEYIFVGHADQIGTNVFAVPDGEEFTVEPGYVIGWSPCGMNPADVAYYPIDPVYEDMYSEYEFKYVEDLSVGGAFSKDDEDASISHYEHMIRAYIETPATFVEVMSVTGTPGTFIEYSVEVSATHGGPYTATYSTMITEDVVGLQIVGDEECLVFSTYSVTFQIEEGYDVQYCINWGDNEFETGCMLTTSLTTAEHIYKYADTFEIYVEAFTPLSRVNATKTINVVGTIVGLDFHNMDQPIPPTITHDLMQFEVLFQGSGKGALNFSLIHVNGSQELLEFNVSMTQYSFFMTEKAFNQAEDILCNVLINNLFSNAIVGAYGSVEDTIEEFEVEANYNLTSATHNQSYFQIFEHRGTNVSYIWFWDEVNYDIVPNQMDINHTFTSFGNMTINITAYNQVSEYNISIIHEVQDTIFGLELIGETHIFTEFTKPSIILFKLNEGTGVECWINYNTTDTLLSPVAHDLDIVNDSSYLIAYGNYTYLEKGIYNVSVYCENDVSNISLSHLMPVEDKITDFVTEFHQTYEGDLQYENDGFYDWVEVNETVNVTVSVSNEGEVWFVYDAGDGRPNVTTTNLSHTFSYPEWSDKLYVMVITAFNRVDRVNHTNYTWVPRPVENMTGFDILHDPENSTEKMELKLVIETGDFFNCSWAFGDGSETEYVTYDTFLENQGIVLHQFAADENLMVPGVYNVSVNCSNRLYTDNASAIVQSYNPVSNVLISLFSECKDENRTEGFGLRGDLFPIQCDVIFVVSEQEGTNVSYWFDFGYINETTGEAVTSLEYDPVKPLEEVRHRFGVTLKPTADLMKLTIKITIENNVSFLEQSVVVTLITPVSDNITTKGDDNDVLIGVPSNITIILPTMGYEACYELDMGDGSSPFVFGHESCGNKEEYQYYRFLADVKLKPLVPIKVLSYYYTVEELYTVKVKGSNFVSEISMEFTVKVMDFPCFPPELRWASAMADVFEDAKAKAPLLKCLRHIVLTKGLPNCLKPNTTIKRVWSLHRVDSGNNHIETDDPITMPEGVVRYVIDPKTLLYGTYHIQLNATMFHNESGLDVPETLAVMNGFFTIERCPLHPEIAGGTGMAVGAEGPLVLDGSVSHDPDRKDGSDMGLIYNWYCKKRDEVFPSIEEMELTSIGYPSTPLTDQPVFEGCFGTGIGRLDAIGLTGPIITIDKSFMPIPNSFDIWMQISQAGRIDTGLLKYELKLLGEEPPIVSIECNLNCMIKKNPTQKTSLIAKCTNCGSKPAMYKWEMWARLAGEVNAPFEDVTHNLSMCASTNIESEKNLVMPAYTLETIQCLHYGFEYKVKLKTYWGNNTETQNDEEAGFAQYSIAVNNPPDISKAEVVMHILKDGQLMEASSATDPHLALHTSFVIEVKDAEDEDIPLTFNWLYLPVTGNQTGNWKAATSPTQGSTMSDPFKLAAGAEDQDFKIRIRVTVSDVYMSTSEGVYAEIAVEPKPLTMDDIRAMLELPEVKYDQSAMMNVFTILLDSLGDPASLLPSEEVKDLIKSLLPSIELDSAPTALMVASILDGSSDESEEPVSEDALANSLETTGNMARFSSELSPEELDNLAKQSLAAVAKFTSTLAGNNSADNMDAAMQSESQMTSSSSGNMISGEAPTQMKTANGVTSVLCVQGASKVANFEVPDLSDGEEECIGATNSDNTKNRYSFADEGVSAVHGNTIGLTFTGKTVANLATPIRITIPNEDEIPLPATHHAYCEIMRIVHLVECNTNETNLILKVRPFFDNFTGNFFVFLNKGTAPSLVDHEINCTLPNPYPENWNTLSHSEQLHFEVEERWRCFIEKEVMNNLCVGRWCAGVVYFTNSTNRTTTLKPSTFDLEEARCPKVNYTFLAYTRACLWWDKQKKNWAGSGCNASRETKDNETICYCDHLTDFGGGGPFAEPHPIDFGAAFSGFNNLGNNPTVFSVVMGMFGLFLILLVWARKKDIKDKEQNQVCELQDNHPADNYLYQIAVKTGFAAGASTTADVYITVTGTEGETVPKKLHNPNRKCFNKGDIDLFLLAIPFGLGDLVEIEIFHNNEGSSPGWYLAQVEIKDMETKKNYLFVANQWLDVCEEDGKIVRNISLSKKEDLKKFDYVFSQTLERNFYDGHIWLSVFTKSSQSTYTRVQRLCTCVSLLFTNMLANAMFYTAAPDGHPSYVVRMGPFIISLEQVQIAITSAFLVIPAHLLIVILFKKAGPKIDKNKEKYGEPEVLVANNYPNEGENEEKEEEEDHMKSNRRLAFLRTILFPGSVEQEDKKPLPHWLVYIAYVVVFLTSFASAFFVILYGFDFGKEKSDKWIMCFLLAFLQSLIIIQPIKVLLLSALFAVLVKEPPKMMEAMERFAIRKRSDKRDHTAELQDDGATKIELIKMPDSKTLEELREKRMKEKILKVIVKEILTQSLFVVLCIFVCYAAVDPNAYYLGESVHKLMGENGITGAYFGGKAYMLDDIEPDGKSFRDVKPASEISNRLEWFDWARYSVVEYLFMNNWYNKDKYALGYIADNQQSKILAMARFRQNRVKKMSCTKHPVFEHLIVECNAGYSAAGEQTKSFSKGWEPAFNHSTKMAARKGLRKALYLGYEDPWRFQTSAELKNFPYWGQFATYGGDSYSVSIGPKKKVAKKVMKEMKDNFWVDRYTRAIFTEANIYNAHTNLLIVVTILHEILPTGGWYYMSNVQALRLYRYVGGFGELTMLFDLIFVIVTLVGLYKIIKSCRRDGISEYLSGFWNILHTIITFCSLLAIALTFGRFFAVKDAIFKYSEEPELFVSFGSVTQLENLIAAFLGFALFFANLEFLRILRFNKSIGNMTKTLNILGAPLASFGLTFIIIFMAYVSFTHCMFADKLENFRDLKQSFVALTMMFMGSFDIYSYLDNAPILGPIMFFSYMMAIQMIMINMFVGIICDAFAEVGEMEPEDQPSVLSFMASRVKNLNAAPGTEIDPIYNEWRDDWDLMMDNFNDRCDNAIYLMKNFENEEMRQITWFQPENSDQKKNDALTAVLGSDFYTNDNEFLDGLSVLQNKITKKTPAEMKVFLKAAALKRKMELAEEESCDGEQDIIFEENENTEE